MITHIVKKIIAYCLILLLLSQLSFALVYFLPGTYFSYYPLSQAYFIFFEQLFTGQLTIYSYSPIPFLSVLSQVLPATLELVLLAIFCAIIIGIPLGILTGLNAKGWLSNVLKLGIIVYACPVVWISILVVHFFSNQGIHFESFYFIGEPQSYTGLSIIDILLAPEIDKKSALLNELKYLSLPVLILSIQPCIITIQLLSQSVANVAKQNYIKIAMIRERSQFKLLIRHLLPNAIPSIIPQLTYNITALLFSTMVVEIIFNRIGIGQWLMSAYYQQNYIVIAIGMLICGVFITTINFLSEIVALLIYPMRYREQYE